MRRYLLPEHGNYYKANLHCHSTVSDGSWTPEEVKQNFMAQGYSIVAYTDHNVLIPHHDLAEDNFLPITGVELDIDECVERWTYTKCAHYCFLALEPDNEIQPCWHREKYQLQNAIKNRNLVKYDDSLPDYIRTYSTECINDMMRIGREKGFFVTYNHPVWSMEGYEDYMKFEHMHAMEICNFSSFDTGYEERCPKQYDDMLRGGKRIYCIATDDNHDRPDRPDAFGGFTMIKADKLEYRTVTKALEEGDFYASEGPLIKELWYEDGRVYITFAPAREAFITKATRNVFRVKGKEGLITEASFPVEEDDVYFRITVEGPDGKRAYTNAYFLDEILK